MSGQSNFFGTTLVYKETTISPQSTVTNRRTHRASAAIIDRRLAIDASASLATYVSVMSKGLARKVRSNQIDNLCGHIRHVPFYA